MIYLDNAATTQIKHEVLEAMIPFLIYNYANPSALYPSANEPRFAIELARKNIAETLNCKPSEIYFTSGGTESNNWALSNLKSGDHIITTAIEHHSILNKCKQLEDNGVEVTYLNVDHKGYININELEKSIKENTKMISIMYANNEIGITQNINLISKIAKKHKVLFHTDAVQAYPHLNIDMKKNKISMMSVSGHKFGAPKGIGFLYIRNSIKKYINPFIIGGGQESGYRAGTENVAGIVGIGIAAKLRRIQSKEDFDFRDKFIKKLMTIEGAHINGDVSKYRLANNINICFEGVDAQALTIMLGENGVCVSPGSACNNNFAETSHVLKAIGLSDKLASSSIRITFGDTIINEKELFDTIKYCVNSLRQQ